MLPFERMEQFKESVKKMTEMGKIVSYDKCRSCQPAQPQLEAQPQSQIEGSEGASASVKCHWHEFHKAIRTLSSNGEIKGVVILDDEAVHAGRVTRAVAAGQQQQEVQEGESGGDATDTVKQQVGRQLEILLPS